MKYRCGFVSNSSSSSFIAIGKMYERDEIDKEEIDKYTYIPEYGYLLGKYYEIYGYGIESLSLQEVYDIVDEVSKEHNDILDDISIIYGSYC